ncbi:MAG: methylenetetrahydrofolate reductase [Pseudomonadota bacterium]
MAWADKLKSREFVVAAEMETPKGVDISDFVGHARQLKGRVDAVLVPDMSFAVMRLSALAGAVVLKDQGLEPIVQFSCRDRNRLALQADLLGAQVLGIRNVIAVEGEGVQMGDHLNAKPVYDLSAAEFLAAADGLSQGQDMGGHDLLGSPKFCMGAYIERWGDPVSLSLRLAEAAAAVKKGASFLVAPPVFDLEAFGALMRETQGLGVPVLASVLLLKSVGMARYINQNLPGMNISEEIIKRIRTASDRSAECVKIAAETVLALKPLCGGVLLLTAGWESRLPEILQAAGY